MNEIPNTPNTSKGKVTRDETAPYQSYRAGLGMVPASTIRYILANIWELADQKELMDSYYLLRWTPAQFQQAMREGTIRRAGQTYQVIYHNTDSSKIHKAASVLLSFRSPKSCYLEAVQPVVLIASSTKPLEEATIQQEMQELKL